MDASPEVVIVDHRLDRGELARVMLITDSAIRDQVREITFALIGEGEPLE
jgi:hypothetical protein